MAWGLGITGLGSSATLNDKLVFAGEDHLDLPMDFSLAKDVSPLSNLLMVSKEEVIVNSCGLLSMITPRNNFSLISCDCGINRPRSAAQIESARISEPKSTSIKTSISLKLSGTARLFFGVYPATQSSNRMQGKVGQRDTFNKF